MIFLLLQERSPFIKYVLPVILDEFSAFKMQIIIWIASTPLIHQVRLDLLWKLKTKMVLKF